MVIPTDTVTVHRVCAARSAVTAVRVTVAVLVPVLDPAAVKVVVPHPLETSTVGVDVTVNMGSTSARVSESRRGAFIAKTREIDDAVATIGVVITSLLTVKAVSDTADDWRIDVAAMTTEPDDSTAAVRLAQLAACATELVVTPVPMTTVH